ncbi:hypothetical protein [Dolosicoccus paucivorans]|uniref:Uncharacterized protein n=1 Tax=Dolosicoccus paucivorans TaxID=84521 RepID=A0A1G8NNY2_9LACT|nr:hypothetical protein [Dolosicoccus paucivorans]PMB84380.1 hypothetical protein CJ206_04375 [Dolosicoccus paucivorans]PMC58006.1 hypothetical protein CJ205_06650 [Dolosicoccus paucivorans]SDI82001.1 hypothetical protein SAMN04487994_10526 [Dolosicoccus paucivorans]
MSKRKARRQKRGQGDDLVQVDIFYLPKQVAEMYRVLREAVAEEMTHLLKEHYPTVKRISDNPQEGEALVGYDDQDQEQFRYYLNPTNISNAQRAREKETLNIYIESLIND